MSIKKTVAIIVGALLICALIFAGCGMLNKGDNAASGKAVPVKDIDGLIAEIGPGKSICLDTGTYNLTDASTYGKNTGSKYCYWGQVLPGEYELIIDGVDGMTIEGSNSRLVTDPRSANVLRLINCKGINIQNLTIGHTEQAEACQGAVLTMTDSESISVFNCALYGCGTIGISANGVDKLYLRDSEIYNCSASAIDYSNGTGLEAKNCSIYECGSDGIYMQASSLLWLYDARDISVDSMRVHDNYAYNFISGNNIRNTQLTNINLYDNTIDVPFNYAGNVDFVNLSMEGNVFNSWFVPDGYGYGYSVTLDGKNLDENDLDKLYGEQLSSSGIGTVDVVPVEIDTSGTKEVHVKTADEFLAAIASDTTIYIDVPLINLTEASDYGKTVDYEEMYSDVSPYMFEDGNSYVWVETYDGYGLYIGNVTNLHIVGKTEIVTEPRYANVLAFCNCSQVTFEEIILGHTPEEGMCTGGVLFMRNCSSFTLESCDLYGCGTYGIIAEDSTYLYVQNTRIHDCSFGAAQIFNGGEVNFIGCSVDNCPSPNFELVNCTGFSWDGKVYAPNSNFDA